MAGAWFGALVLAAVVLEAAHAGPAAPTSQRLRDAKEQSAIAQVQLDQAEQRLQQARDALIKVSTGCKPLDSAAEESQFYSGAAKRSDFNIGARVPGGH